MLPLHIYVIQKSCDEKKYLLCRVGLKGALGLSVAVSLLSTGWDVQIRIVEHS